MSVLGIAVAALIVGGLVFRAARVKKRSASDWYIAELRKAKARRTHFNPLGTETSWLTRSR